MAQEGVFESAAWPEGADVVDHLEVDREGVQEDEEAAGGEEDINHTDVDEALFEDAADKDGALALIPLHVNEEDHD